MLTDYRRSLHVEGFMSLLNKFIVSTLPYVPKPVVGLVASRYIAGDKLDDAVHVTRNLNGRGIMTTIDLLGEDVLTPAEGIQSREICKDILQAIEREELESNLSLKLTQIGLKVNKTFCEDNLYEILVVAREEKTFVRIDMEDHTCTDATLEIYRNFRKEFDNFGVAIQSYLRRSEADVRELTKLKTNVRLVKGIYVEPESIAYRGREEIRDNFLNLLRIMLENGCYVGIATHDEFLIDGAYRIISDLKLSREKYEFQTLLGVRPKLRQRLLSDGHRVRVYVPFGKDWHPYSIRRLQENPQIAMHVLKSVFTRNGAN